MASETGFAMLTVPSDKNVFMEKTHFYRERTCFHLFSKNKDILCFTSRVQPGTEGTCSGSRILGSGTGFGNWVTEPVSTLGFWNRNRKELVPTFGNWNCKKPVSAFGYWNRQALVSSPGFFQY